MPTGIVIRSLFLSCLATAVALPPQAPSPGLYKQPDLGTPNIRIVQNQIVINAPHTAVFDYATTWTNVPEWLPLTAKAEVVQGNADGPSGLRDHLEEFTVGDPIPLLYTVAVFVPSYVWTIAGFANETTTPFVGRTVTFTTIPLSPWQTLFVRVYEEVGKSNETVATDPTLQSQALQPYLENLKALVEKQSKESGKPWYGGFWRS